MDKVNKVIITGCTGAIGIALINQCIMDDIEVFAFCRKNSTRNINIPKHNKINIIECNLDELDALDELSIPKADVFFHLGWGATMGEGRNDARLQLKNVQYTIDALYLAKKAGCEVFVGTGSQAEYGRYEGSLNENVPTNPENGYGIAKLCAGQLSRMEATKLGIKHIWARVLSVYGPYDNSNTMISSTIDKLLRGERPQLTKGEQQWDYMYSEDTAKALLALAKSGVHGRTYCLGSGNARPLLEYINILKDNINPDAELGIGDIPYGEKQVMYLCADISALREDTGFVPQTTFEEGIKNTINWMREGKYHEDN